MPSTITSTDTDYSTVTIRYDQCGQTFTTGYDQYGQTFTTTVEDLQRQIERLSATMRDFGICVGDWEDVPTDKYEIEDSDSEEINEFLDGFKIIA